MYGHSIEYATTPIKFAPPPLFEEKMELPPRSVTPHDKMEYAPLFEEEKPENPPPRAVTPNYEIEGVEDFYF